METATKNNQSKILWIFAVGIFMAALDNGIISAALTTINKAFDVSASWGTWGITLYTLGLAISVPIVGKLSDRYGRKKLFVIEVAIFGLGSLLVALSQSFPMFLAARFFQAIGGGGIFIIGSSYVLTTFPKDKQGKALGMFGGMNGMAAVLGPNIGSFLLDLTGGNWHWLFLINLPIAAILVGLGIYYIPETKGEKSSPLDMKGTALLAFAILSLMYGLTNLNGSSILTSISSPKFYGFVLLGIALFTILFTYENKLEQKGKDPILSYSLIKRPVYLLALLIGLFAGALIAALIFVPAYAQNVLGITAEKSGYWMTPLALASGIGAAFGGRLIDKKGPIQTLLTAGIVSVIGFGLFPLWVEHSWQFLIASVIAGVGFGMVIGAPVNVLATEGVSTNNKGSALGTLSLVRQIGLTLSPTIYAGFITRGSQNIGTDITTNLQKAGVDINNPMLGKMVESTQGQDPSTIMQSISKIPDPTVQQVISDTIHNSMQHSFGLLFGSGAIAAACIIVVVLIAAPIRKKEHASHPVDMQQGQ